MRKFTHEELVEAYKQIEEGRELEKELAYIAARWVMKKTGNLTCPVPNEDIDAPGCSSSEFENKNIASYLITYAIFIACPMDPENASLENIKNGWVIDQIKRSKRGWDKFFVNFWITLGPAEGFPEERRYMCFMKPCNPCHDESTHY